MYKLKLVIKNSYPQPILLLDGFGYWLYDSICRPVKDIYIIIGWFWVLVIRFHLQTCKGCIYNAAYASYEVPYSESARHMQVHNN